ncbi:MAG: hypothetical protein QM731_12990 [Chitinophagaceae bacterium]
MWRYVYCLTLIFPFPALFSQSLHYPSAATTIGSGAYSQSFSDAFSFLNNQASLGSLKQVNAGVYGERRYMLEELNFLMGAVGLPVGSGGLGVAVKYFGWSQYNESSVGLAYGKNLGKVNIGVQFNYTMLRITGYGSDNALSVEAATTWQITDQVQVGLQVINPVGGKFSNNKEEKLASVYKTAIGWEASSVLYMSAELVKEENKTATVLINAQYRFANCFFARGGIATASGTPYLGVGWKLKNIRADITGSYHPQLGITPGLTISFYGKSNKE